MRCLVVAKSMASSSALASAASTAARPSKLHGYDFYRSIGSPKHIMAPMVDQSELSFRMLGRMYGVDLAYSPMLHARLCAEQPGFLEKFFTTCPADRPLVVQFAGDDPDTVLAAAKKVEKFCDAVDLNLGESLLPDEV